MNAARSEALNGLNVDEGGIWASPLWECGVRSNGNFPECGTSDDWKEGVVHWCVIGLELALNVDDENRRDRRGKTSLSPRLILVAEQARTQQRTYED
jgi:hypothetical protein